MTPEERKAIAMRQLPADSGSVCGLNYPECCDWHNGFDAALTLLEPVLEDPRIRYTVEATP